MYLTYDGDLNDQTYLSTTEVYDQLVAKHARLTIFLTDCCNSKAGINRSQVESVAFGTRGTNNNADIEKLRTLFLNESGTIRATAAKAGQYALCDASGGFMLTSILNNIKAQVSALSNVNPSWTTIVENASKAVAKKTSNQIDEAGNEQPPQVVVRSVKVKGSSASDNKQSSLSSDYDKDNDNGKANNQKGSTDDDDFGWSDLLCLLSPIIILILLIVFIVKRVKNKNKNKQN
jgi:hypothetical protein